MEKKAVLPPIKVCLLSKKTEQKHKCELCNGFGSLMCASCRLAYYCTYDHFRMDKDLHAEICDKFKVLRKPIEFSSSSTTRERLVKQRNILLTDMCESTYQKGRAYMEGGNYDRAIPAATESAKYALAMFGHTGGVLPSLLVAAECYVHKGMLSVADGFLARALFIELNSEDVLPLLKAHIRRIEGLTHLARNNFQEARECFAEEVYQCTEQFGPTHIRTSGGYCYLGYIFYRKKKYITAASLFRQTVDIWFNEAVPMIEAMTIDTLVPMIKGIKKEEKAWMQESDRYQGLKLLSKCYYHFSLKSMEKFLQPTDMTRTCYAIAALNYIGEKYGDAKITVKEGLALCKGDKLKTEQQVFKLLTDLLKYCDRKLDAEKER